MNYHLALYNYFEIGAFIISLIFWKNLKTSALRWFPLFLLFIVLIELTGKYIRAILHQPNAWLYNFSTIIEFLFYTYLFLNTFQKNEFKKLAIGFMVVYPLLALTNILFIQGLSHFHSHTMIIGSFFMLLFSCLYFYELLKTETMIILIREPMFWISTGILFFYAGDFFYNLFFVMIFDTGLDNSKRLFSILNNNLILVLYSCFSIGFICRKNTQI